MRSKLRRLSIVIPVFNEQRLIASLLKRVAKAPTLGYEKEIIVVDDASTDKTRDIIKHIHIRGIKKIFLTHNIGKGGALRQGFIHATGDLVLIQDADWEYDPNDYPVLLAPFAKKGVRVVYGSRELNINRHSNVFFFWGGKLVTWITNFLFRSNLTDVPTGFKVIARKTLMELPLKCERFEFCPELTALLLTREIPIAEVPISYTPRSIEQGKKIRLYDGLEAIWTLLKIRMGR